MSFCMDRVLGLVSESVPVVVRGTTRRIMIVSRGVDFSPHVEFSTVQLSKGIQR